MMLEKTLQKMYDDVKGLRAEAEREGKPDPIESFWLTGLKTYKIVTNATVEMPEGEPA